MKKLKALLLGFVALPILGITGCDKRGKPVECDIKFLKGNTPESEKFDTRTFEINTKIYVHVSFDLTNYSSQEDIVQFEVNIPGAEYYSTYDFEYGTKEPQIDIIHREDGDTTIEVIHLSAMQFVVKPDKVTHHRDYIFSIAAKQPCENMNFEAVFGSRKGFFKDGDKKEFTATYSFVEGTN